MRHLVRSCRFVSLCLLALFPLFTSPAHARGERQLVDAINDFRSQTRRCEWRTVRATQPLVLRSNLGLPIGFRGGLRETLQDAGYQAWVVRSIRLTDARDAEEAFEMLADEHCAALLDNQYADIGVNRVGDEWRLVLAQPMGGTRMSDVGSADKTLLAQVNAARAKPRMCGRQRFAATRPLSWNAALGTAAQGHSRSMAQDNYFAHRDPDGRSTSDRARSAGFRGRKLGENIAAGQRSPSQTLHDWLASPGHCANLMNPMFTQMGAASASDSRSDARVYWTMVLGAP
ncbi:Cysteine-rich secretory protein family protein [Pseudomonas sp. NFACC24-1]|uniref:CAP domain-containing protein n=1 Tax=Pseudomonas sp. NFACC24-1 TaxID=1566189 RepID=UPI0008E34090|nr:CAP domain-containing protein [Pseudomonas sp. NFACC24-1]SFO28157.1 Cysteine-rich secretory protein family protein [Pseudomonas sp. NFACC24-1]